MAALPLGAWAVVAMLLGAAPAPTAPATVERPGDAGPPPGSDAVQPAPHAGAQAAPTPVGDEADEEEEQEEDGPPVDEPLPADAEPAASDITNDLESTAEPGAPEGAEPPGDREALGRAYADHGAPQVRLPEDESRMRPLVHRPGADVGLSVLERLGTAGLMKEVRAQRSQDVRTAYYELLRSLKPAPAPARTRNLRGAPLGPTTSDIPLEDHEMVRKWIRFFQGVGAKYYRLWVARYWRYGPMMREILKGEGVPQDLVFLSMIESGFSPKAYSFAHAAGQWQFIRSTGSQMGLTINFWVDERRDPIKATHSAARYLRELYQQFGDWRLAWAGYNGGPGRVSRAIRRHRSRRFFTLARGRTLRWETRNYVPKLMAAAIIGKDPARFGFGDIDPLDPFEFDPLPLQDNLHLSALAHACGTTQEILADLNPQLRRPMTPPLNPTDPPFVVRVPKGAQQRCLQGLESLSTQQRTRYRRHHVQPGDTLGAIAKRFSTTVAAIVTENNLPSQRASTGEDLIIPVPPGVTVGLGDLGDEVRERRGRVVRAKPPRGTRKVRVTVKRGDTLWDIATHHGVDVRSVVAWNGLNRRHRLRIGQKLLIYVRDAPSGRRP